MVRWTCVALAVILASRAAPAGPPDPGCAFHFPVVQFDVDGSPRAIAVGNLNGDGYADIVSTKDGSTEIAIILSTTDGTFAPAINVVVGNNPYTVAVARLNADAHPDIVVGVRNDGTLVPVLNDGLGGFTAGTPLVLATDVFHVEAGDLDGDLIDDAIVTQVGTRRVTVCLNDGAGVFSTSISANYAYGPYASALGDVDGDGLLDLGVVEPDAPNPLGGAGVLYFYPNLGTKDGVWQGFFPLPAVTSTSPFPQAITFANLDGLPGLEAVVSCNQFATSIGRIDILSNFADGPFVDVDTYTIGTSANDAAVGDLDGDSDLDIIAVSNINEDIVTTLINNGSGAFAPGDDYDIPGNHLFISIGLGDLDADGDLDPVIGGISGATITALPNRGDGTFAPFGGVAVGEFPNTVRAVDLNKDNVLDLLTGNGNTGISIAIGNGDGSFAAATTYATRTPWGSVAIGDYNEDTWPDIATFNGATISVLLNNQASGFTPGPVQAPLPMADSITGLAAGFLDNDPHLDLAAILNASSFPFRHLRILLGDGTGGFTLGGMRSLGDNAGVVRAVNVDADADTDLIVLRPYISDGITVLYNDGAAGFAASTDFPATIPVMHNLGSIHMAVVDLNGDGALDVATANFFDRSVSVLLNNSAGVFATQPRIFPGPRVFCIDAADVDGDMAPDLVVGINQNPTITEESFYAAAVMKGAGDGTFGGPAFHGLSIGGPWDITTGDLNGDKQLDIAAATTSSNRADILLNQGCLVVPTPCPGDADGNGMVNFGDITSVLTNWAAIYPTTGPGDSNHDGVVNFSDITSTLTNWASACASRLGLRTTKHPAGADFLGGVRGILTQDFFLHSTRSRV